jgi:hypothetical protein
MSKPMPVAPFVASRKSFSDFLQCLFSFRT